MDRWRRIGAWSHTWYCSALRYSTPIFCCSAHPTRPFRAHATVRRYAQGAWPEASAAVASEWRRSVDERLWGLLPPDPRGALELLYVARDVLQVSMHARGARRHAAHDCVKADPRLHSDSTVAEAGAVPVHKHSGPNSLIPATAAGAAQTPAQRAGYDSILMVRAWPARAAEMTEETNARG